MITAVHTYYNRVRDDGIPAKDEGNALSERKTKRDRCESIGVRETVVARARSERVCARVLGRTRSSHNIPLPGSKFMDRVAYAIRSIFQKTGKN